MPRTRIVSPAVDIPHQSGTFVTANEPAHHDHPIYPFLNQENYSFFFFLNIFIEV